MKIFATQDIILPEQEINSSPLANSSEPLTFLRVKISMVTWSQTKHGNPWSEEESSMIAGKAL